MHASAANGVFPLIGILCHGSGSGSTRAAFDLAAALKDKQISVVLLTLGHPRWRSSSGVRQYCLAAGDYPVGIGAEWNSEQLTQLSNEIAAACHSLSIDLLHYHYAFPFADAAMLLKQNHPKLRLRLIATLHGGDIMRAQQTLPVRHRLAQALACCDAVSTVSQAYAERSKLLFDRPIHVVPNFLPSVRRSDARFVSPHSRVPIIIHISNFRNVKNVRKVGQIFLAVRRHQLCRLLLVGDGPQRLSLQALLRAQADSVTFTGFQRDTAWLLKSADIMLITSSAESFSLAALEAMAAGLAIVAPDIEGLSETLGNGKGGLLYSPGRWQDAALKLDNLMRSPHDYRALSRSAREWSSRFSEDKTVSAYEAIYGGRCPP